MGDIYGGIALTVGLALSSFGLVSWGTRNLPRSYCRCLALVTVGLLILYILYVWDQVWLCRWLPFSNLIVVGNLFPILTSILAACVARDCENEPWRRRANLTALMGVGMFATLAPVFGSAPQCGNAWLEGRVCLQTTDRTCTPACAATLLRGHGIDANEQEMARLCLTRRGTTWQGLYHGLRSKTAGSKWDVRVAYGTFNDLRSLGGEPAILRITGGRNRDAARQMELELGLRPGVGHSVVFLRFVTDSMVEVADPAPGIGIAYWTIDELAAVWDGQMVRLTKRPSD